jgi:hypothetical protein
MAVGAVAAVGMTAATAIVAASWIVSIGVRASLGTGAPTAPGATTALADRDDGGARADAGSVPALAYRINVPNLNFETGFSVVAKNSAMPLDEPALAREAVLDRSIVPELPPDREIVTASIGPVVEVVASRQEPVIEPAPAVPIPPERPKLAYAKPGLEEPAAAPERARAPTDARTAVYDIEARTVYLPNGKRLEAHSGLGDLMDDPRHVNKRMRGATPPNTYQLALRESLFHGVRAIRMNPVDEDKMFGRDGILAHSYMLGRSGQSNGCVSFKDYSKFLQAYLNGEVDRLVVVPRLGPEQIARFRIRRTNRYAFDSQ